VSEYGGIDHIVVPVSTLWVPDITLYNKYVATTHDMFWLQSINIPGGPKK